MSETWQYCWPFSLNSSLISQRNWNFNVIPNITKTNKMSFSLPFCQLCGVHKKAYTETECRCAFIHIMESDPLHALYINCLVMLWHHIGAENNEPNLIMYFLFCYLLIRFFGRFIYTHTHTLIPPPLTALSSAWFGNKAVNT